MRLLLACCHLLAGCHLVFELEPASEVPAPDLCPVDPDLRLCIDFENLEDGLARDRSSHSNHATIPTSLKATVRGDGAAIPVNASILVAVPAGRPTLDLTGDLTYELWFGYEPGFASLAGLLDNDAQYGITLLPDHRVTCSFVIDGSTTVELLTSVQRLEGSDWYHVACVRDGANLLLYVDGQFDNSSNVPTGLLETGGNQPLYLGHDGDTASQMPRFPLSGRIDDVRIFARALDARAISAHVAAFPALR